MIRPVGGVILIGVLSLIALPSHASLFCNEGDATEGISASDMTYDGASAADCYGVKTAAGQQGVPLNEQTDVDALVGDVWGGGWQHLIQGDNSGEQSEEAFLGYTFTLTYDGEGSSNDGTKSGNWALTASGSPLPANFDFVAGMFDGSKWGLWYFPGIEVSSDPTDNTTWSIAWSPGASGNGPPGNGPPVGILSTNDNNEVLSHLTLFARSGIGVTVPEPTTLGLLGLGLLGLAAARRRR